MRLRRNWQGEAELAHMPGVLGAGAAFYQKEKLLLPESQRPLHIEIGMGKGDFLMAMAAGYPDTDFVGVERALTIMHIAADKNRSDPLPNLYFLPVDAKELDVYFRPGQVGRIYLNFSDPWPKIRHAPRRLTTESMLKIYHRLLKPGGQIHLKTDQEGFFQFSLNAFIREGWSVGKITYDLYRSGFEGNVMTEYERRFLSLGLPIYRLEAWSAYHEN